MKTLEELGYEKDPEDSDDGFLIYRKDPIILVVDLYNMGVTKMVLAEISVVGVTYDYDELKAIVALLEDKK